MRCEEIHPVIRNFLDDLLDEKDYQEIQAHLAGCEHCHSYASSVGTLSYRLYELGQVALPPDMASTILYEFNQQHRVSLAAPPKTSSFPEEGSERSAASGVKFVWVLAFVAMAVGVGVLISWITFHRLPRETTSAVLNTEQVREMAPVAAVPSPTGPRLHWHYHISSSNQDEFTEVLQALSLTALEKSSHYCLFLVPQESLSKFKARMDSLSGVVKEFGDTDIAAAAGEAVQVSVYFE